MQLHFTATEVTLRPGERRRFATGPKGYYILLPINEPCRVQGQEHSFSCGREDIVLMQPGQTLFLESDKPKASPHLLCLLVEEPTLIALSDETTDFLRSFNIVSFGCVAVHGGSQGTMLAKNLIHRLVSIKEEPGFGDGILQQGILSMLLVLVLRACIAVDFKKAQKKRSTFMVDDVFVYIREHLTEEITLRQLEGVFFVSHEHIAREFKRQTGQTIHRYILSLRMEQACTLLLQGLPVSHIWQQCGFGSYAYFFQAFRKRYGMTPKAYAALPPEKRS